MLDYCIESFIIYSTYSEHILVIKLLINIRKRSLRAVSFAASGATTVGEAVAYSPLVEIPSINEFQVKFGRGYGYKTLLDYASGTMYQRYFSKEQLANLIQKHNGKDKILDGIFFNLLSKNKNVVQIMKKKCHNK